jgi:hypothetical protein
MVVINKKNNKPNPNNSEQSTPQIPETLNTGIGVSSPIGYGAYSAMNTPHYLTAISTTLNHS